MFIVNNTILSKQEMPEVWDWYSKKINKIKNGEKKHYTFSSFKKFRYEKDEMGKMRRMRRFKTVPSLSTIDNNDLGETQTWIYVPSANAIRNENGILRVLNQKPFMISESQIYSANQDAEIIFYLTTISEAVSNKKIFLIDQEAENIEKANEAAIAAEAQYLIFSPQSPISEEQLGTDEIFRQLGIAYGVQNSYTLHLAELKNKLWNNLLVFNKGKKHLKNSYKQFIKDCYNSTDSEFKSSILLAVERGIINFKNDGWWIKIRGEYDELIVRVPPNETANKKDILVSYLTQHKEYMAIINEAIENTVGRIVKAEQEEKGHTDDIDKMLRPQMIKVLSKVGFKPHDIFKKGTEEMREMIKQNKRPA